MQRLDNPIDLESKACPNGCAPSDTKVVEGGDRLSGVPGRYCVVRCSNCELMRTNPRPTPQSIGAYYPEGYGPYHASMQEDPTAAGPVKEWVKNVLGLHARSLPTKTPGHLVEVGCANGAWLAQVAASGWKVEGIEFSSTAATQARERGLNVQVASVETATPPSQQVDVIAAWMVLEHLHDPVRALRRLRDWTHEDGWLIASVPDASALDRRLFGSRWSGLHLPNHLYHYTPSTIRALLARAGWKVVGLRWQRNASHLIGSLIYTAEDLQSPQLRRFAVWLRDAKSARVLRAGLAVALGTLRQSSKMEIVAKPDPAYQK